MRERGLDPAERSARVARVRDDLAVGLDGPGRDDHDFPEDLGERIRGAIEEGRAPDALDRLVASEPPTPPTRQHGTEESGAGRPIRRHPMRSSPAYTL
jgi:hypothetical protein